MTEADVRFISPTEGMKLFALQMQLYPELLEEVHRLSGGKIGLINEILVRMGDAISEDPVHEITPPHVRDVLGVPEDEAALPEWQSSFWEAIKAEREARHNSQQ